MNKLRSYPKYKDSGVEWIGDIPEHWIVSRVKNISSLNPSKSIIKDSIADDTPVTFLPMEKVSVKGDVDNSLTRKLSEVWSGFTYFENSDVLLAKITPCFENGKGAIVKSLNNGIGFGSTEFHVLRYNERSFPDYLFYLTRTNVFKVTGEAFMTGAAGQKRVPSDFIETFPLGAPPLSEQKLIAGYLDKKTGLIDELLEKKRQMIEFLKEKRTATINQAVTKGLDPTVPMKDSGIDWLGDIPEYWTISRFRRHTHLQQGLQIAQQERHDARADNRFVYLTIKYINSKDKVAEYIENPKASVICHSEEILMARTGATGQVITGYSGVFHNNFFKVNYDNSSILRGYLLWLLNNPRLKEHFLLMAGVTTIPDLNHGDFLDSPLMLPPLNEQQQIVEYLGRKTEQIDTLITKTEQHIDLLQERRAALINDVVTGKIDIREEV